MCSLSCPCWGLGPTPRLRSGGKDLHVFSLEKKGLQGWCRDGRWLYFSKRGFTDSFVFLCLKEERDTNYNRKDFMRYKEKSLPSHRLLETKCWRCWRRRWKLLALGFGLRFIFPWRERQLGINKKALNQATFLAMVFPPNNWHWTKCFTPFEPLSWSAK